MESSGSTHATDGSTLLDPDEIKGLKFKHITTKGQLDHLEQANIESGLIWLKRRIKQDLLTEYFIKSLHKKLFGEVWKWAGTFRKSEKNIGIDPIHIPTQLRLLLDNVQFWIARKIFSPIEIAIRFHHKLVYIHCFPNGNGRHARIITDALLIKLGMQEINWAQRSSWKEIEEGKRQAYLTALRQADKGNYSLLLDFANK